LEIFRIERRFFIFNVKLTLKEKSFILGGVNMWVYEKPDNLVEWWLESEKKFSNNVLFWTQNQEGTLDSITYGEIGKRINNARGGLAQMGIGKDDAVGIISANRPEWAVLAYATYGRNARYIPMYEKELVQTWKYIIKDSEVKFLMVSTPEFMRW
jgi:long-chain acyl-CoA synthetase